MSPRPSKSVRFTIRSDHKAPGMGVVPYGPGLAIDERFGATVDREGWPLIEMDVVVEDGRPVIERWELRRRVGGPPIKPTTVRSIPIREVLLWVVRQVLWSVKKTPSGAFHLEPVDDDAPGVTLQRSAVELFEQRTRRGRPRTPPETVAKVLDLLEEAGDRKRAADWVAKQTGVSRTTVYEIRRTHGGAR